MYAKRKTKPFNLMGIGTKAKLMFSAATFLPDQKQKKIRNACLQFYITSVQYLQNELPYDIPWSRHAQFFHPEKQNTAGDTSDNSNITLKVCLFLKNHLNVFLVSRPVIKEHITKSGIEIQNTKSVVIVSSWVFER